MLPSPRSQGQGDEKRNEQRPSRGRVSTEQHAEASQQTYGGQGKSDFMKICLSHGKGSIVRKVSASGAKVSIGLPFSAPPPPMAIPEKLLRAPRSSFSTPKDHCQPNSLSLKPFLLYPFDETRVLKRTDASLEPHKIRALVSV
jgi:hypothetical protein